jgi:hypothetical protein
LLPLVVWCRYCNFAVAKYKKQPTITSGASTGNFDYFLLTLSGAEFCASNPNRRTSAECAANHHMD